mmetsp:Transcript_14799/g.29182  ORF Transcript_14799/g.29182 Transcript_14799/m.29182 type:complete len:89 (-) Transcript_14799:70-336(-)
MGPLAQNTRLHVQGPGLHEPVDARLVPSALAFHIWDSGTEQLHKSSHKCMPKEGRILVFPLLGESSGPLEWEPRGPTTSYTQISHTHS